MAFMDLILLVGHQVVISWNEEPTKLKLLAQKHYFSFGILDDGYLITQEGDVHKPAESLTKKKETKKLSERIQKMKDKRKIKDKLG